MISGRYVRYRNMLYCIWCDICDSVRRAFGRKKENPDVKKSDGYGRWENLEQGGGVNMGIPGIGEKNRKKEKR